MEPHHNGPLFVELNFYCRAAKNQDIEEYTQRKNLSHLGVPDLKGSGKKLIHEIFKNIQNFVKLQQLRINFLKIKSCYNFTKFLIL